MRSTLIKKLKFAALGLAILTLLTLIAIGVGYWFVVPKVAEDTLRTRLATLERDANVSIVTETIEPDGLNGVKIKNFKVIDPDADAAHRDVLHIEELTVGINRARLLAGDKVISSVDVHHASVNIHRDANGEVNLERLLKTLRASRALRQHDELEDDNKDDAPGFLRHFGGVWPDLDVKNVQINFSSDHITPFPLEAMHMETVQLSSSGEVADMETTITITPAAVASERFILPRSISTRGTLAIPLEQSSMAFTFDRPFKVTNLPFAPSLAVGLSNVELSKGGKIVLTQITLEETLKKGDIVPLFDAERAELRLEKFTTDLDKIKPLELVLLNPNAHVRFHADGSSNISDLIAQVTSDDPKPVTPPTTKKTPPAAVDDDQQGEEVEESRLLARLRRVELSRITHMLPDKIDIKGGRVLVDDARTHELVRAAKHLELQDGTLLLEHDAERGSLSVVGGFEARAGEKGTSDRGGATLNISGNYKTHMMKLVASARELDLSWLAQMGGERAAKHLKGGVLRAKVELEQKAKGSPYEFSGDIALEQGHLEWAKLAEEPLKDWSVGYDFKGYYDPNAAIPAATLLKTELDANVPENPDDIGRSTRRITEVPPERGALVFTRGKARAGDVKADFTPAMYGIDRKKPLPARLDLGIKMPMTPIQAVLDAIPAALLGDIAGAKINGGVKMDFLIEVPLYDASNMVWRGEPETSGVEIVSLPASVDVRQMVQSFSHTITDEKVNYERQIRIPQMSLLPSQWLIENAGLEPSQLDYHWEAGGWAKMEDGVAQPGGNWKLPARPWGDRQDARIRRYWKPYREGQAELMVSDPYGPYVFVPLQYISHWLPRAIFTTEDNSFFKHDGFNRLAMRQSVERNLAEGDYVRGASTISMQLIKNLYLTRKKVMARKIQEAMLVWLMESVVHVPKARMLEIYLNIIEFAPGVFGIHDASVHYFGKRPDELTLAECAWLVTIVPGPKRYHSHYMKGEMSDNMFERIKRYMKIMQSRGRVTEEELAEAFLVKPSFNQPAMDAIAIAPLPVVEQPAELEHLFPGLFGEPTSPDAKTPGIFPTNPAVPKDGELVPKRMPLQTPPRLPGRAQPDPAPPTLR